MKQDIVKDLTIEEIREKIAQERAMYTKLKLSHAVSPIENPMKIRASRRAIARLETEYRKRISSQQQTK
ncbi:MAG: 50S ribosomal protein L29 [Bacteroidota bacterium]|jgi:large subunit ribosomal protein L29